MSLFIPIFIGLVILSTIGVAVFRVLSKGNARLLDKPNERSLHSEMRIRGAGIVIAILVVLALYLHLSTDGPRINNDTMILTSLIMIAAIGFLDDLFSISAPSRFLVHIIAASVFCLALPMFSIKTLWAGGLDSSLSFLTLLISILWISWSTNAFNFMDGADGVAGVQSLVGGLGATGLGLMLDNPMIMWSGGALAATSAGFLFHNWSPAKVFLGDVGSSFMGFIFGTIPVLVLASGGVASYSEVPLIALCLAWPFYFDATGTLLKRLQRGVKVWKPHREHGYQRMILAGSSHAAVATGYGVLSLVPITFMLVGLRFESIFHILAALGLIFSTVGMYVFSKHSRMPSGNPSD